MLVNEVRLIGNLVKDINVPTALRIVGDKKVLNFVLAINIGYGDTAKTQFIDCLAWQKQAEYLNRYGYKGSRIELVGHLQKRSYEKDGTSVSVTEVVVDECHVIPKQRIEQPIHE